MMTQRSRTKYKWTFVILVIMSISIYWATSQSPYGPGPSVKLVEQRGIFAYLMVSQAPSCSPDLETPVKSCVAIDSKTGKKIYEAKFNKQQSLTMSTTNLLHATQTYENHKTENGFKVSFGVKHDNNKEKAPIFF